MHIRYQGGKRHFILAYLLIWAELHTQHVSCLVLVTVPPQTQSHPIKRQKYNSDSKVMAFVYVGHKVLRSEKLNNQASCAFIGPLSDPWIALTIYLLLFINDVIN